MASPEIARRVDRQAEDLRAISDTVLDVKEVVDQHTATLAGHTATLTQHTATLAEHGRDLTDIKGTLAEILTLLRQGR